MRRAEGGLTQTDKTQRAQNKRRQETWRNERTNANCGLCAVRCIPELHFANHQRRRCCCCGLQRVQTPRTGPDLQGPAGTCGPRGRITLLCTRGACIFIFTSRGRFIHKYKVGECLTRSLNVGHANYIAKLIC